MISGKGGDMADGSKAGSFNGEPVFFVNSYGVSAIDVTVWG